MRYWRGLHGWDDEVDIVNQSYASKNHASGEKVQMQWNKKFQR
jgi:hypothetical protein